MSNRRAAKIVSLPLFSPVVQHAPTQREASSFEALRQRAAKEHGRKYWRSLKELAETPEFAEYVEREFPSHAGEWHDPVSRRNFVKLMGASLALAGVGINFGCEQNEEKIVPYVYPPENLIPGKPLFYASAMPFRAGQAVGVLVEQHMGRPTKIEGNPDHPASLGATDAMTQASVLSLYDPDRSQAPLEAGNITTWSLFSQRMTNTLYKDGKPRADLRIRILTETVCSPTLGAQLKEMLKRFPQARWHQYEPINRDNINAAFNSFGPPANVYYDFSKAERILSLDSNFLHDEPGSLRYARQFSDGRRLRVHEKDGKKHIHRETATKLRSEMKPVEGGFEMNRLYVAESTPTITGAVADHRLAVKPSMIYDLAMAIARGVVKDRVEEVAALPQHVADWAKAVVADLNDHTGKCIVIAGEHQPKELHVLAHAMNRDLGNVGKTVFYTDPIEAEPQADSGADAKAKSTQVDSLKSLTADLNAGNVDLLLILGGNPVYNAPADLEFEKALDTFVDPKRTKDQPNHRAAIHLSPYFDETSYCCNWHLPESHFLEAWGDLRAFDGTVTFQQPLITPIYGTRSAMEVVGAMLAGHDVGGYDLVRDYWRSQGFGGNDFDTAWNKALHDGVIADSAMKTRTIELRSDLAMITKRPAIPTSANSYEIVFRPDPNIWDGRFANNGWLMELPKPLTKITWDNVILVSPRTAEAKFGFVRKDFDERHMPLLKIKRGNREVVGALWVSYGHPDDSVTVYTGFGRTRSGRIGGFKLPMQDASEIRGFNAYAIRTSDSPGIVADALIDRDPSGKYFGVACTQHHQLIDFTTPATKDVKGPYAHENLNEQRDLVRMLDYSTFKTEHKAEEHHPQEISIYPPYSYDTNGLHKWGMVIDQTACIGCNACITACQAENNIAVVGKEQVVMQREMFWLRVDTYYTGDPSDPEMLFQPMLCQHCETAPCEVVCPVAATSHSDEGINEMTYNRCVGTRYCSNNCPYKVRRFNFLQWNENWVDALKMQRNPDVTVRNRGVMEKCSFCVQRVNQTRIEVKKLQAEAVEIAQDNPAAVQRIHDKAAEVLADLQTACQQVCPTEAIVFGDLNYTKKTTSKEPLTVTQLKQQSAEVHYALLTELNTQPRTTYLARFRNLNPALAGHGEGEHKPAEKTAHS